MPKIWTNHEEWIIANTAEDAHNFVISHYECPDASLLSEWEPLGDAELLSINIEGDQQEKSCHDWIREFIDEGQKIPCFVGSIHY